MLLCILLMLFSLFLLIFASLRSPCIVLVALFTIIFSIFFSFSLLMAPLSRKVSFVHNVPVEDKLPKVPQTLAQVRSVMDDKEFEIFSAALVR